MLEIICVIWLWKVNGRNALARGQKPTKYHVLTLVLWFGLESLGTISGMLFFGGTDSDKSFMFAYICGIIGAAAGGFLSYRLALNAPQGDYRPEGQNPYGQGFGGQSPYGQKPYNPYAGQWNQQGAPGNVNPWQEQNQDMLTAPATVRILTEPSFRQDEPVDFYLNGRWVCRLNSGCEYTFLTSSRRNIVTVGNPVEMGDNNVKFIAAAGGYTEIHTQDGRMLPERFKNFTSKPS
ncbi:hypothetical protein NE683_04555 [Bariatricus massiliensis]|uniref:Uncharacterized protein n=1 Tax=Bariatricus massiliensis TaxID=1745713 RepID=A0ABS8DCC8_9FIRM|nr:hypothetical protein [Bariatricus massiliensis]MCB7303254.1 hypothetical protein [Bariatricus massiliensis]MCB7373386.1 hypothetical protein [Bariatricus massiliensis]MCB7386056.1 hypothetical protein [Bariatricus massiliensis]MCB7410218.1 hypothetical protein [Bariatricus massiliensis]MCQ5252498.1 hypothetical protein [Bariatricus massiliensis]